jgi:hypothetical protein
MGLIPVATAATAAVIIATTTTTAATAAAAVTTTATATTTTRTLFARAGNVDRQSAAAEISAVQGFDGLLGFFGGAHGDETKTTGTAAHAVHHQVGFNDSAVRREGVLQFVLSSFEGKISNKQLCAHVILQVRD